MNGTANNDRSENATVAIERRKACLDHAENLIKSSNRVLGSEDEFPNIAFHLGLLAMEEIGKAQLIVAGVVSQTSEASWPLTRLDDHVHKLMWAIWSPRMLTGPIDPKWFSEARTLAKELHSKRLEGLYVKYDQSTESGGLPSSAVSVDDCKSLLNMAKTAHRLESEKDSSQLGLPNPNLDWFLKAVSDERGQKVLFSEPFVQKLNELGEPREWITWARDEMERISAEEVAVIERERARSNPEKGLEKPRWVFNIRLTSRWHAIRQKSLNLWNDQIPFAQFEKPKEFREGDFLLKLTLYDNIKIDEVFDAGFMWSKMILACFNVGTGGFVWFQVSGGQDRYYDKVKDLKNPDMSLEMGKPSGLTSLIIELAGEKGKKHKDTLTEAYTNVAIKCFFAFSNLSNDDAAPIFSPYFQALVLLSKSDLHLSCEKQAKDSFLECLLATMKYYTDWNGLDETLVECINSHISEVLVQQDHRDKLLEIIDPRREAGESSVVQAFHMKRLADLCLSIAADKILRK